MAGKRQRHDADKTPSGYAAGVKEALDECYVEFSGGDNPSFLTAREGQEARASISSGEHERHLVAHMTPIFMEKFMPSLSSDFVLVNSEEYGWISQSADLRINYTAPDHFISPHYLVEFRRPYKDAPSS